MYFPDLSEYAYHHKQFAQNLKARYGLSDDTKFLNIGWLDSAFPYETGTVDDVFLDKLWKRVEKSEHMMRGFHECQFCPLETYKNPDYPRISMIRNGKEHDFGCTEIFVIHQNIVFIAPDLIFHYITTHSYKPPAAFYDAVMAFGVG